MGSNILYLKTVKRVLKKKTLFPGQLFGILLIIFAIKITEEMFFLLQRKTRTELRRSKLTKRATLFVFVRQYIRFVWTFRSKVAFEARLFWSQLTEKFRKN